MVIAVTFATFCSRTQADYDRRCCAGDIAVDTSRWWVCATMSRTALTDSWIKSRPGYRQGDLHVGRPCRLCFVAPAVNGSQEVRVCIHACVLGESLDNVS